MTFLQQAPLNAWVALDAEETQILAIAWSLRELKAIVKERGLEDIVVWKNPPAWAPLTL